jgi:hypothetical protein
VSASQAGLRSQVWSCSIEGLRLVLTPIVAAEQAQGDKKPMFDKDGAVGKQFQRSCFPQSLLEDSKTDSTQRRARLEVSERPWAARFRPKALSENTSLTKVLLAALYKTTWEVGSSKRSCDMSKWLPSAFSCHVVRESVSESAPRG